MASHTPGNGSNAADEEIKFDEKTVFISTTFLVLVILMALFGNFLVIVAFAIFQKLRNVTNYFIVSLAVADILVAGISMPVWAAYLITGPTWKFDTWVAQVWSCIDILCGVSSIIHLSFISLERQTCISSPLTYHDKITPSKTVVAIFGIWLFSVFMAVLKIIVWSVPPPAYEIAITVSCFFIPLIVMLVCYMKIYKAARHQIKKIILTVHGSPKRFLLSKEIKAAKTVGVLIGAFIVCWAPFFVLNLIYGLCKSCMPLPNESVLAAKWLHYVNSVLNPIIYACMNKDFRSAFKKLTGYCCMVFTGFRREDLTLERSIYSERSSIRSVRGNSLRGKNSLKENSSLRSYTSCREVNGYNTCDRVCYV